MIAREGYAAIAAIWVMALLLALVVMTLPLPVLWRLVLSTGLCGALGGYALYFFRDPPRVAPPDAHALVLAPADGTVIAIKEENEPLYLEGPARRVSIFLSVLDVHVNRIPADGVVEYDHYVSGSHYMAWRDKASHRNERSQLGVHHPSGARVLFKQVAGGVTRRVVYHIRTGDTVKAGDRFGLIRFGSRLDVLLPLGVPLSIAVGDRVRAGETAIGRLSDL